MVGAQAQGYLAGVDIGGTKILTIIADGQGHILAEDRTATPSQEEPQAAVEVITASLKAAAAQANIAIPALAGIGLAAAGACDVFRGIVTTSPNLPQWHNVPLARMVQERLGVLCFLENDASAAALGECAFGAGRDCQHMLFLTISTGVGGGIIIDRRLYRGTCGSAGEMGHMTVAAQGPPCKCGSRGCLEALVSGWALAQQAQELLARGQAPGLARLLAGAEPTAAAIHQAALDGDTDALGLIQQAGRYLGIALASLVNIFNPQLIVIGGGLSNMGEMLLAPARQLVRERAFSLPAEAARIEIAHLGQRAGALGALAVVQERLAAAP